MVIPGSRSLAVVLSFLIALAAVVYARAAASADGPYGGVGGGANFARDQDLGGRGGTVEFDDGPVGLVSLGYAFRNGWRPELEYAYRDNDTETLAGTSAGKEDAEAVMANLWYDFPSPGFAPRLRPYAGAGAGAAEIGMEPVTDGGGTQRRDNESVFAYQLGTGVGFDVTRRFALSVGYRYFHSDDSRFEPGAADARYRSDSVLAGLRYTFGAAPTRPPLAEAAPAAAPAQPPREQAEIAAFETVVLRPVNFQFDHAELTPPARAILDELSARLTAQPGLHVLIEGHTDSVGSAEYNEGLGRRRAEAVRDYLISRGVDRANLRLASRGETELETPEDTPEGRAANRRAEMYPLAQPANVRIRIEGPSEDSVEAAETPPDAAAGAQPGAGD